MEKTKWRSYILYAIGEIFLVMIGILLALQVNNWNEERKERKEELIFLNQLLTELEQDSLQLQQYERLTKFKINQGKTCKEILLNGQESLKDTSQFVYFLFLVGRNVIFQPYLPSWDELISSGKLQIFKNDELKSFVRRYMRRMETYNSFLFNEVSNRKEEYNRHINHYFSAEIMPMIWNSPGTELRFAPVDTLETLGMDLKGFFADDKSKVQLRNIIGSDTELNGFYKQTMDHTLSRLLGEVREEIATKKP